MQIQTSDAPLRVGGLCMEEGDLPLGAEIGDAYVIADGDLRLAWWDGDQWLQAPAGETACPCCSRPI